MPDEKPEVYSASVRLSANAKNPDDRRAYKIYERELDKIDPATEKPYISQRVLVRALLALDGQVDAPDGNSSFIQDQLDKIQALLTAFGDKLDALQRAGLMTREQADSVRQDLREVELSSEHKRNMMNNLRSARE